MSIFVGMDLGSKSIRFELSNGMDLKGRKGGLSWKKEEWKELFEEYSGQRTVVAFETGPESYRAKRILDELEIESHPFHAQSFLSVWKSKKKTDRIDASKIRRALQGGALPEKVHLPDDEQARLRNLISQRELHQKMVLQLFQETVGLSRQWGVGLPKYTREKGEEWWKGAIEKFPKQGRAAVEWNYRIALTVYQTMEELENRIEEQVDRAGQRKGVLLLLSVPGIGKVIAPAVIAYLGDGKRFPCARRFTSYVGLTPAVDQTGGREARLGHISKEGPSVLRRLFIQAARRALKAKKMAGTRWKKWFDHLVKQRGKKIAIVALARKLAEVCYAVIRDGVEFDPSRLRLTKA
jgi:transposase